VTPPPARVDDVTAPPSDGATRGAATPDLECPLATGPTTAVGDDGVPAWLLAPTAAADGGGGGG
jgi:hypothetical protein